MPNGIGRILILAGIVLIITGLVFSLSAKLPWIGRLPGDIYIKKENVRFYFPLTTSILLSVLISLILFLTGRRQ
jgi:thiosulfate reductase cytochrome b subunit